MGMTLLFLLAHLLQLLETVEAKVEPQVLQLEVQVVLAEVLLKQLQVVQLLKDMAAHQLFKAKVAEAGAWVLLEDRVLVLVQAAEMLPEETEL